MPPEPPAPPPTSTPNRLAAEKSPYLLQHARNPVDWYPWGEEAFERARARDCPIFLSIGYATCHWCHVMEHESFEDPRVAALLNEHFVSIKVDREERPDIDGVYMTACQLMTHQGGWPLTVVMTSDKRPFFVGTYFPRESVPGRIGMLELLPQLSDLWRERRPDLEASGTAALEAVRDAETRGLSGEGGSPLDLRTLERGADELATRFDPHRGGFGSAPRFPTPHQLLFLMRWHHRTGEPRSREMVAKTLTEMRRGGIFDHVGYGFHRYSTDARWLVPHFEKMLYDQALLAMAYVELWRIDGKDETRRVAEEIFEYVLRDLTGPEGAFYSAEDADSEGREGAFYVWTRAEIDDVLTSELGADAAALARRAFDIELRGNFADESTGVRTGENILHRTESLEELAATLGRDVSELARSLEAIRETLSRARRERVRPLLDDKVLTDWNGLMLAALAMAGRAFGDQEYTAAAARTARFILARMRAPRGRLLHRYRDGEAGIRAGASDYAYLAWGLLELYSATLDPAWLEQAGELIATLLEDFWDADGLGVFTVDATRADVPVRQKEVYDGATPSANAVTWYVLLRLGQLTGDAALSEKAAELGRAMAGPVSRNPSAHTMSLVALDLALGPSREVVIVGRPEGEDTRALLSSLNRGFRPRTAVLLKPIGDPAMLERIESLAPFTAGHELLQDAAAAYVCTEFACQRPTSDASEMSDLLD